MPFGMAHFLVNLRAFRLDAVQKPLEAGGMVHENRVTQLVRENTLSFRQACVKNFNYAAMIGYQLNREDNQWKSRAHRQQALKKFSSD